ncbi:MAG: zinc ribbon domain-containing protein, partial [Verrucomicrobia bacterium]|nr:zinc ribbon domain-containing protein [Verrucomicrobiota bacterium]
MEAAVARDKHACPACGGDAHWNPAKQALVCPYCGTTAPASLDAASGLIVEHDLASALRSVPEEGRGWRAEKHSVKCRSCQAISVIDASRVGQRCDFCGAAQLIPYEQTKAPISPESILVFKLSEPQVREAIRAWYGSHWLAPGKLKSRAMTDVVKGLYIPYWTFDAHADASWTAESGYYYYEMEQYRGPDGKTLTRRVQRVRWEPSAGHLQHFFDDELVPGTKGVHEKLLRQVEPFP